MYGAEKIIFTTRVTKQQRTVFMKKLEYSICIRENVSDNKTFLKNASDF